VATFEEHCADCVAALGEPFEQVHRWLDELFATYGLDHRPERHHVGGVEEVRKRWGDRAAQAAEIHIRRDYYGELPTEEQAEMWKLFRPSGQA